jgi:Lon protease-like protein
VQLVQRYRTISDLPQRIPVFPLRGCILLPRTSLPLNIFEPRYLAMLDDVIRGDRLIGIIQPVGDGGDTGSPQDRTAPLHSVGCAGRLVAFQELDDGRLVISLTGIARFELNGEAEVAKPYRMFGVDYRRFAADLDRKGEEDTVDRTRLLDALRRYLGARNLEADWDAIARSSTEQLINCLSVASPFGCEEKQALLEAKDLKTRAETLVTLAEMEIAAGDGRSGTTLQ